MATHSATAPTDPAEGLRSDVTLTYGAKIVTAILGFAATIVLARGLGPDGRGVLAVAFAFVQLLTQLGTFGLATANPYWIARDQASTPRVVANAMWSSMVIGLALVAAGLGLSTLFPDIVEGVNWVEVAIALAGAPAMLAAVFLQSVLLGEGRMLAYNGIEVGQAALALVLLVLGFGVFDFEATGALAVLVVTAYAGAAAYAALLVRHRPPVRRPDVGLFRAMLRYSLKLYVAGLLAFLVIRIDLLLVNAFLDREAAGHYSIAVALAEGMMLLPAVVGLNLFTRVARGTDVELTAAVFRVVGVFYAALCAISVPLAEPAIRIVFGEAFLPATSLWMYLVPGVFSLGMLTILSHHFAGRGFPVQAMLVWFLALGVNLAINIAFLERHGTVVASIASSVAYILLLVLHVGMFSREAGDWRILLPRYREMVTEVRKLMRAA